MTAAVVAVVCQPVRAQEVQVTGVQINPADVGIDIVLTTRGGALPEPQQSTSGNTAIFELEGVQLQLSGGQTSFRQDAPAEGITAVTVQAVEGNRVRVEVIGASALPSIAVESQSGALTLGVIPVIAQGTENPDAIRVVVGNRRPTPVSETPATVRAIPEEQLQREQPLARSVVDNLQTLPGIAVNRLGLLTGSLNIRGLTGERIGLLVDGERIPNRQFGPSFSNIDPFRIERVEVLYGPGSSIYGADTFGGVVSLTTTTPRPDRPFEVRGNLFGGSFSEFAGNAEVRGPNYVVGTTYRTAGDARDGSGDRIPLGTSYRVFDLYASGRVDLSERDRLEIRLDRYRQNDVDLPGFATPTGSPFQITAAQNLYQNRDRYSLAYVNEGAPGGTSFSVRGYYQRYEDQTDTRNLLTLPPQIINRGPFLPPLVIPGITVPGATSSEGLTETFGFTGQANTRLGRSAVLTYGYDFSRDAGSSRDLLLRIPGPLATRTFNGVFVQSSYDVIPPLTLAAGLRYDNFNTDSNVNPSRNDSSVTFNTGAVYRFGGGLALRANFAQGFRPPRLLDLFGSNADRSFFAPTRGAVLANANLEPERSNNIDVGLSYTTNTFQAGVTYFRNDIPNFLGFRSITPRFTQAGLATLETANKDVLIQGVELSAAYTLSSRWVVEGNFTYADSRDRSGDLLSQLEVLPITALLRLRYDDGQFTGFVQSRIYGGQGTVLLANNVAGEGSAPATVFDISVGYRVTRAVELNLSVENLLNADYTLPTVNIPAPGIRAIVGVRAIF
jgi:iron complex outermembrane receptor protein